MRKDVKRNENKSEVLFLWASETAFTNTPENFHFNISLNLVYDYLTWMGSSPGKKVNNGGQGGFSGKYKAAKWRT